MYQNKKHDMTAFGQAVKEARERKGLSREKLAEMLDLSPRYLMYIETRGQHPSLQKLYEIATFFDISVDQFFYPDTEPPKSTRRRQLDKMLDSFSDNDLIIVESIADGIKKAKTDK
jgi:transcriptional regulator with XRE-family HTH domain